MAFGFTAPTVSRGYGYSEPIKAQVGGYQREDFLNSILDAVNKASKKGAQKTGMIGNIANVGRLMSSFLGPAGVPINAAIGVGETYFSDKAMGDMEKSIRKQKEKGFLSSELPEYLEDVQRGRKDMLQGNILKGLASTGMAAYKQGMFDKTPPVKPEVPFDFEQGLGEKGDWTLPPRQYSPKGWGSNRNQLFRTGGGYSKDVDDLTAYLNNLLGL